MYDGVWVVYDSLDFVVQAMAKSMLVEAVLTRSYHEIQGQLKVPYQKQFSNFSLLMPNIQCKYTHASAVLVFALLFPSPVLISVDQALVKFSNPIVNPFVFQRV